MYFKIYKSTVFTNMYLKCKYYENKQKNYLLGRAQRRELMLCKSHPFFGTNTYIITFRRIMKHTKNTNSNNRIYLCSQTLISL